METIFFRQKMQILWAFADFADLQFLSDMACSKNIQVPFSALISKNWPTTCITPTRPKIRSLCFLTSRPRMTLTWHEVNKGLIECLTASQIRYMPFYRHCFHWIRFLCPSKSAISDSHRWLQIVRNMAFDLICGVIRGLPTKLRRIFWNKVC